jgi:hypothetical protein
MLSDLMENIKWFFNRGDIDDVGVGKAQEAEEGREMN